MGNLFALLRLESGAVEQRRGASAARDLESAISSRRLAQLNGCIPGPEAADLQKALNTTQRPNHQ